MGRGNALTKPCPLFSRGLCAEGDDCTFLHDRRVVQTDILLATALRDFVQHHGGKFHGCSMEAFYREHPEAKVSIGGNVRKFCQQHSDLLRFQVDTGGGMILSVPVKAQVCKAASLATSLPLLSRGVSAKDEHRTCPHDANVAQHQTGKNALTKPCPLFARGLCAKGNDCTFLHDRRAVPADILVATALRDFVHQRDGRITGSTGLMAFYREHPEAKAFIAGKIRKFCELHSDLVRFQTDTGDGMILSVPLRGHAFICPDTGSGPECSSIDSRVPKDIAVATSLRNFVEDHGGRVTGSRLSLFYQVHPDAKGIIGGRLRDFCEEHSDLLRYQLDDGVAVILSVSSKGQRPMFQPLSQAKVAADSSSVARGLALADIVAEKGGSMPASQINLLCADHPDAKAWFVSGLRAFCAEHPYLLRFVDNGGQGVVDCVRTATQLASGAEEASRSLASCSAGPSLVGVATAARESGDTSRFGASSSVGCSVFPIDASTGRSDDAPGWGASSSAAESDPRAEMPTDDPDEARLATRAQRDALLRKPEPADATKCASSKSKTDGIEDVLHTGTPSADATCVPRRLHSPMPATNSTLDFGGGQEGQDPWLNSNDPWSASLVNRRAPSVARTPVQAPRPAMGTADGGWPAGRTESGYAVDCISEPEARPEANIHTTPNTGARFLSAIVEPLDGSSNREAAPRSSGRPAAEKPGVPQPLHTVNAASNGSEVCGNLQQFIASATATFEHLIEVQQQAVKNMVTMKADLDLAQAQLFTREARLEASLALVSAQERELAAREARLAFPYPDCTERVGAYGQDSNISRVEKPRP